VVLILQRICERVLDIMYFWLLASLRRYNPQSDESLVIDEGAANSSVASSSGQAIVIMSEEQIWLEYFKDPSQWWDNRLSKKNLKAPDFKHKVTKRALWIDGWYTLAWVKIRFSS
jgi:hypothetical protein